jgi:hypothetical protein
MWRLIVLLMLLFGCAAGDDTVPPSCASLGCPQAPSGSPDAWSPCDEHSAECYCVTARTVEACDPERGGPSWRP